MWTIDAQCPRCTHKKACLDRPEIIKDLSSLTGRLNSDEKHLESTGDGVLIVACKDFSVA